MAKARNWDEFVRKLRDKPRRRCLTLHGCCLCDQDITLGQQYHDGGYGRRAHVACVDSALTHVVPPKAHHG